MGLIKRSLAALVFVFLAYNNKKRIQSVSVPYNLSEMLSSEDEGGVERSAFNKQPVM